MSEGKKKIEGDSAKDEKGLGFKTGGGDGVGMTRKPKLDDPMTKKKDTYGDHAGKQDTHN